MSQDLYRLRRYHWGPIVVTYQTSVTPNKNIPITAVAQLIARVWSCPLVNDVPGRDADELEGVGSMIVLVTTTTPEAVDGDGVGEGTAPVVYART